MIVVFFFQLNAGIYCLTISATIRSEKSKTAEIYYAVGSSIALI